MGTFHSDFFFGRFRSYFWCFTDAMDDLYKCKFMDIMQNSMFHTIIFHPQILKRSVTEGLSFLAQSRDFLMAKEGAKAPRSSDLAVFL